MSANRLICFGSDIVPTYLQQCSIYLARLADTFTTVNSMTSSYIAMEALFTIYSVFHALAQDRQKDLGTLFAAWTKTRSHPTWRRQWNGISESIIGIVSRFFHPRCKRFSLTPR